MMSIYEMQRCRGVEKCKNWCKDRSWFKETHGEKVYGYIIWDILLYILADIYMKSHGLKDSRGDQ